MVTFLTVLLMVCIFCNLLGSLVSVIMLWTSMRKKCSTAKLFQQSYRNHKLQKAFSKFCHYALNSKLNVGLKMEGLSEPELYCDLVYRFKKVIGMNDFTFQVRKIITGDKRIGYNLNFMRQSTRLVSNPITVDNYAAYSYFNGTPVGRASGSMMVSI